MAAPTSSPDPNASVAPDKVGPANRWWIIDAIYPARTCFAAVISLASLVVIGIESQALHFYHRTLAYEISGVPLWPEELNTRPSVALIAGAAVIFVPAMVYVVASVQTSSSRPRNICLSRLSLVVGVLGYISALSIVILTTNKRHEVDGVRWTILSWTCTWIETPPDQHPAGEAKHGAVSFSELCSQSALSLALRCDLVVCTGFLCMCAAGTWYVDAKSIEREGTGQNTTGSAAVDVELGKMSDA